MKIEKISTEYYVQVGNESIKKTDILDINNSDYEITSKQAWASTNSILLSVSFNTEATSCKQVSDFVEMEYSINDSTEIKRVILSTIQLYED